MQIAMLAADFTARSTSSGCIELVSKSSTIIRRPARSAEDPGPEGPGLRVSASAAGGVPVAAGGGAIVTVPADAAACSRSRPSSAGAGAEAGSGWVEISSKLNEVITLGSGLECAFFMSVSKMIAKLIP